MEPRDDDAERRHRLLLVVLVLLVVVQPVWSRIVNELWDALSPRVTDVRLIGHDGVVSTTPAPPAPASEPVAPVVEPPARPRPAAVTPERPEPVAEAEATPVTVDAVAPRRPPEVLGASPRGEQVRVLVDLRGNEVTDVIDDICQQAQAFVEPSLSGRTIRVLAQSGEEPTIDGGEWRCP